MLSAFTVAMNRAVPWCTSIETFTILITSFLFVPVCQSPINEQTLLNAWGELTVEDLSGRCPHVRVGLLPDP